MSNDSSPEAAHDIDEVPWTTAPEHAEEAMRELGIDDGSDIWSEVVQITTRYGLEETLGSFAPTPSSLAAGAIYLYCRINGKPRCQATVADAVGVSKMSIRQCYQAIMRSEGFDGTFTSGPPSRYDGGEWA